VAQNSSHVTRDRYEPLPGLASLPRWIWRRLPRAGRVAVACLPVVAIVLAVLLGPGIDRGKKERARTEAARLEQARTARLERIRVEQRPRFASGPAAGADLQARRALLDGATATVAADARRRVAAGTLDGPIRGVECEPYPRTTSGVGADRRPALRYGRYSCLAATTRFGPSERGEAGTLGHPYRLRIDFQTGEYALCKVSGRAGEGSIGTTPFVAVSRSCGGF
jgi:hypothetical protein